MKTKLAHYKFVLLLCSLMWGLFSLVAGQYYYFDSTTSTSPYQQWCAEDIAIRINTESNPYGARAGLIRLLLDPLHFSYSTSSLASVLQTNLFVASTETFSFNTSPWSSPSWIDPGTYTQLQIDRNNSSTDYKWSNGLYGTVKFTPLYNTSTYTGTFSMIYNGDTVRTSLSKAWGTNIIDPAHQTTYLTGYYPILQKPCTDDTTSPGVSIPYPTQGSTKQSYVSGISLILTDNAWSAVGVPFVRTGDVPGVGIWTWNLWSTTNQYGINLSSFHIWISGNGTGKYFTGDWFSLWGPLSATPNAKTWQYFDKNYTLHIPSSQLFDFGVEQPITITGRVYDRNNNGPVTFTRTFNAPVQPWLIAGSASPAAGDSLVATNAPILLWIADDRAGVNSWSIIITLSGSNYWPYIFSGTDLNLSGVQGTANHPDYYLSLINHPPFASSGTIQVIIDAQDMVGNVDNISTYTFSTKPSCTDLWCCKDMYIQIGNNTPFVYNQTGLSISDGIHPLFTNYGNTWVIDCWLSNEGIPLYKWTQEHSWAATPLTFFGFPNLILSWTNVRAVLSWHTLYLERIYVPPITWWCIGSCWGGWWGWSLQKDICPDGDNSTSYYDNLCEWEPWHGSAPECNDYDVVYSDEINHAFQRGYALNITNRCPIDEARLYDPIIRQELAKMMTMFTVQVLGIYPNTHKLGCDQFSDTSTLSDEMQFFTKTACQLWLMGLEPDGQTPKQTFDPHEYVSRAQFGTVLSRLIYGDANNLDDNELTTYARYHKHLYALQKDHIMNQISSPSSLEKRARVLLMLKRTVDNDLVTKYRFVSPAINWSVVLLENVW